MIGFSDLACPVTQEDQNKEDEEKRREAIRDLVESWMDRLQLISVIVGGTAHKPDS